jgi:uncharacterized membrane protein YeaQ/YmgE (transglycosylase-associated protein family)
LCPQDLRCYNPLGVRVYSINRRPAARLIRWLGAQIYKEEIMWGLISTIVIGFVVGVIAKLIMPGKENMGFIMTTVLGIAGSLAATYAGQFIGWYEAGQGAGWIGSIVGAFVVLWAYLKFKSAS